MTSRRVTAVKPEKLRSIAEFLRIAHDLPEIAEYIQEAATELEHYKCEAARLQRSNKRKSGMLRSYHD